MTDKVHILCEGKFQGSNFINNMQFFHLCGVAGQCIVHTSDIDIFIHSLQSTRLGAKGDLVLRGVASRLQRVDTGISAGN